MGIVGTHESTVGPTSDGWHKDLQINWLFKSVDYNKREISVIERVQ